MCLACKHLPEGRHDGQVIKHVKDGVQPASKGQAGACVDLTLHTRGQEQLVSKCCITLGSKGWWTSKPSISSLTLDSHTWGGGAGLGNDS